MCALSLRARPQLALCGPHEMSSARACSTLAYKMLKRRKQLTNRILLLYIHVCWFSLETMKHNIKQYNLIRCIQHQKQGQQPYSPVDDASLSRNNL